MDTQCAMCSRELKMLVIKGRPRFFERDAKGCDRNITHCPGCRTRLEVISADAVREQTVRVP